MRDLGYPAGSRISACFRYGMGADCRSLHAEMILLIPSLGQNRARAGRLGRPARFLGAEVRRQFFGWRIDPMRGSLRAGRRMAGVAKPGGSLTLDAAKLRQGWGTQTVVGGLRVGHPPREYAAAYEEVARRRVS
jgi:hypothetical protein